MEAVVLVPALFAAAVLCWRGFRFGLVACVIPALLLLPAYYTWKVSGVPVFTFHNYLLLAAMLALLVGRDRELLRPHAVDLLVLAYWVFSVQSELVTRDFHEAKNLFALSFMTVVAPYTIGRAVGQRDGLLVGVVGSLLVTGALIGWASPFEARMGRNPFDLWRDFWPVWVPWDGALYRSGIRRVAGPFAHPICAGFFFSMALPLFAWLRSVGLPAKAWQRWGLGLGLALGILTPLSRGPMLGAAIGLTVYFLGTSRFRTFVAPLLVGGALVVTPLLVHSFRSYASVSRGNAQSDTQETAAYRWEMLDNYMEVVGESPWVGYGRYQVPVVAGQKSIDNQYLFLALTHGVPLAVTFLLLLLVPTLLLVWRGLRAPPDDPRARLAWALAGVLAGAVLTQTTVFAGTQTAQVLLLLQGVAVSLSGRVGLRPANQNGR